MNPQITEKAKKIIEEIKSKLIEGGQQSVAYISGIQYALTNPELLKAQGLCNEWVRVEDRLPELNQRVLVIQNPKKTATKEPLFSHFNGEKFVSYHSEREFGGTWIEITHWMPLPTPPNT